MPTLAPTRPPATSSTRPPCPGTHPGGHQPPGAPIWCAAHAVALSTAAADLPDHAALAGSLGDGTLPQGRYVSDRTRGRSHDAPPSPSPAFDALQAVHAWALEWLDTLGAIADDAAARQWYRTLTLPDALYALGVRVPDAATGPVGAQLGREVLATAERVQRLAGLERARFRMVTPCPRCDTLGLVREDGTELVQCTAPGCAGLWSQRDYARICRALVRRALAAGATAAR